MALGTILKALAAPILKPLIDKIPDVNERRRLEAEAEAQLVTAVSAVVQGQLEINKQEAQHTSVFVAGWRPAVGWICGAGLGWNYIIAPLISWAAFLSGVNIAEAPQLDIFELMTILGGMLGLAGMRSWEKNKGVARNRLK